ncbi:MAG: glycosyltransferase [Clostridia bacterium]|nr:glycosyltransferase [Clostridia bacterium]
MLDFILNCILWTLALYGLLDIMKIVKNSYVNKRIESNGIFVIVAVKNQEHQIEGFLRSVIFRILYGKEEYLKKIIVTDLDSIDNTKEILEKISKDYEEIKVITWEDCKKQLDNME